MPRSHGRGCLGVSSLRCPATNPPHVAKVHVPKSTDVRCSTVAMSLDRFLVLPEGKTTSKNIAMHALTQLQSFCSFGMTIACPCCCRPFPSLYSYISQSTFGVGATRSQPRPHLL